MKFLLEFIAQKKGIYEVTGLPCHKGSAMHPTVFFEATGPAPLEATKTRHLRAAIVLLDEDTTTWTAMEGETLGPLFNLPSAFLFAGARSMSVTLAPEAGNPVALETLYILFLSIQFQIITL